MIQIITKSRTPPFDNNNTTGYADIHPHYIHSVLATYTWVLRPPDTSIHIYLTTWVALALLLTAHPSALCPGLQLQLASILSQRGKELERQLGSLWITTHRLLPSSETCPWYSFICLGVSPILVLFFALICMGIHSIHGSLLSILLSACIIISIDFVHSFIQTLLVYTLDSAVLFVLCPDSRVSWSDASYPASTVHTKLPTPSSIPSSHHLIIPSPSFNHIITSHPHIFTISWTFHSPTLPPSLHPANRPIPTSHTIRLHNKNWVRHSGNWISHLSAYANCTTVLRIAPTGSVPKGTQP